MSDPIKQVLTFSGTPHEIYEIFMDAEKHGALIETGAEVNRDVGGEFSVFNGAITGKTLELAPDQKIVQSWRAGDWPEGHYSTAIFELEAVEGGTRLSLTHNEVPEEHRESIDQGWHENYWDKLEAFLAK